ncbi:phosphatase PAP2 family protein [Agarivorans sp. MS3-6]
MRLKMKAASAALLFLLGNHAVAEDTYVQIGDYTQILLPLGGLGVSLAKGDYHGSLQLTKSFATTMIFTHGIKFSVDKRRPNFTTNNSFPSGHTAAAFSGASFFQTRYGSAWGVPAYALAGYTGWSRVHGDKHYWDDVIAGASIATLSNLFFVNPISEDIRVSPMVDGDATGLQVSVSNSFFEGGTRSKTPATHFDPKFRFDFLLGPTRLKSNDIGSFSDQQGIEFGQEDTITSAAVRWTWTPNTHHSFSFLSQPYEARDEGKLDSGDSVYAQYQVWDNMVNWQYDLQLAKQWIAKAGLGVLVQYAQASLYPDSSFSQQISGDEEWLLYPLVNATLGYKFTPDFDLSFSGQYGNNGDGELVSTDIGLNYAFNARWDIGGGYNYYKRDQDNAKTFRKIEFDTLYLRLGYAF